MNVEKLLVSEVYPNPKQPRKSMVGINDLAENIAEIGQLQPIVAVKTKKGYMIDSGEWRWRAHKLLNKKHIWGVLTKKLNPYGMLAENLQRRRLNIVEKMEAINRLLSKQFGEEYMVLLSRAHSKTNVSHKVEEISKACRKIGVAPGSVYVSRAVLLLDEKTKEKIIKNSEYFTDGVVMKLAKLKDKDQLEVTSSIVKQQLNSSEANKEIYRTWCKRTFDNSEESKFYQTYSRFRKVWRPAYESLEDFLELNELSTIKTGANLVEQVETLRVFSEKFLDKFDKRESSK